MDHDYRVVARENNFEINKPRGDDLAQFPIEKARFRSIWYVLGAAGVSMIGYGRSMQFKVVSYLYLLSMCFQADWLTVAIQHSIWSFLLCSILLSGCRPWSCSMLVQYKYLSSPGTKRKCILLLVLWSRFNGCMRMPILISHTAGLTGCL